jgi:hypothetical protein
VEGNLVLIAKAVDPALRISAIEPVAIKDKVRPRRMDVGNYRNWAGQKGQARKVNRRLKSQKTKALAECHP